MSISSTTRKAGPFTGNDSTTVFPFAFKVFQAADLRVVQLEDGEEDDLTLDSDYTVALNADQDASPGGNVTLSDALATGTTLVITSDIDALQPMELTNAGGFFPRVLNDSADRQVILVQQLGEKVSRTVMAPLDEAGHTLPTRDELKGSFLTGNPTTGDLEVKTSQETAALLASEVVAGVIAEGDEQVARVEAQGDTDVARVIAEGDDQVERVTAEGDEQSERLTTETNGNLALIAAAAGPRYPDTATGLAAVSEGDYFLVVGDSPDIYAKLYRDVSGVAVAQDGGELSSHAYNQALYALAESVVVDVDGQLVRRQLSDALARRIDDQRARAMYFLDGTFGSDSFGGAGSHRGGKLTVAGLLPKTLIDRTTHGMVKVDGYTGVYKVTLDKGASRPRGMEWGIFCIAANGIPQAFAKVESIAECDDFTTGAYYDPTPGARRGDVYFRTQNNESGAGNPLTDGLDYYAQMGPPNTGIVGVRAGSEFIGGRSFDPPGGFQALVGIGRGALPIFNSMKALGEDDFELSDHVDADGVVYQTVAPIIPEDLVRYLNDACHNHITTDPDGLRYPDEIVDSVAECRAKAGTIYLGTPGNVDVDARGRMAGAILFIHPRFNKDPTDQSDGTTYEWSFTARPFTLTGANGATDRSNTHQGQIIEGIVCIAGADGQGPIENDDTVYRRICSEDSGKHALTIENGSVEDCIAFLVRGGANGGDIPFEGFATDTAGLDITYNGVMVISPDHWRTGGTGLYCHGNTVDGALASRHDISRYVSYNGWGIVTNSLTTYINGALFLSGPIDRANPTLAGLEATLAGDPLSDRDVVVVTSAAVSGEEGAYVWNAALETPGLEKLPYYGGTLQANAPGDANRPVFTYIRHALFNQVYGPQLIVPSAGSVPNAASILDVRDSLFMQRDGYPRDAISPNVNMTYRVINNIFVMTDTGIQFAWNASFGHAPGSEFSYNIILDFRSATGSGKPVFHALWGGGGGLTGVWDHNVYCLVNPANTQFTANGVPFPIEDDADFALWQDGGTAYNDVDANSIALFGDDWQDLFLGDPRTGDLRLRPNCPLTFGDSSLVIDTAGIRTQYDWNRWGVRTGQPSYIPVPPKTSADCRAYTRNPYGWNWRTGAMDAWAQTV